MLTDIFLIVIGLALLIAGGDYLVTGSVAVAERAKLSHAVIGLTIVAFGTSAPELLVSTTSMLQGSSGIALGNVLGSNIANIALILGITALIRPVPVKINTLTVDVPFLLICSALLIVAAVPGTIWRWEGIVAVLLLVGFVAGQIKYSKNHPFETEPEPEAKSGKPMNLWLAFLVIILSLAALAYGADFIVDGASGIARRMGVSERVIGLTIVAIGTSLPELFASVMAARKGETDMAIGNVIGSNIFNILAVLGITATVSPITGTMDGFFTDYVWMTIVTSAIWLFLRTGFRLTRLEGIALTGFYILYIVFTLFPNSIAILR